jgi:hypothetical protein
LGITRIRNHPSDSNPMTGKKNILIIRFIQPPSVLGI